MICCAASIGTTANRCDNRHYRIQIVGRRTAGASPCQIPPAPFEERHQPYSSNRIAAKPRPVNILTGPPCNIVT